MSPRNTTRTHRACCAKHTNRSKRTIRTTRTIRTIGSIARAAGLLVASLTITSVAGCRAEELELVDGEVVLRVRDPLGVRSGAPLAWALAWPRPDAEEESNELGVITAGGVIDTSSVTIPLARPDASVLAALEARIAGRPWNAVHRPRLLVYEDVDGDGTPTGASDRWLGLDADFQGLGYVIDPVATLRDLGLTYEQYFYDATGGRYSAWVRTDWSAGYPVVARRWTPDVVVVLTEPELTKTLVECRPLIPLQTNTTVLVLDDALDPSLCGLDTAECTSTNLEDLEPPRLDTLAYATYVHTVECHAREDLASLVTVERTMRCVACRCGLSSTTTAYVTTATAAPEWWPCGDEVPYCPTTLGLTEPDALCALQTP